MENLLSPSKRMLINYSSGFPRMHPADPMNPCVSEQVDSGGSQSQGCICTLLLELLQKQRRRGTCLPPLPQVSFTPLGKWGSDDALSEQPSSHNRSCRIKPVCHWVSGGSSSYLSGHEVIWSCSSLFKNGALPHQLVLRGVGY